MIFLFITIIILTASLIFSFFWFSDRNVQYPVIEGEYAVRPSTTGKSLFVCGSNSKQECTFTVNTLSDAISLCKNYINVCSQFSYTLVSGNQGNIVKFIDYDGMTSSNSTDVYIYQPGIIK